jgi:hypothetical protein
MVESVSQANVDIVFFFGNGIHRVALGVFSGHSEAG